MARRSVSFEDVAENPLLNELTISGLRKFKDMAKSSISKARELIAPNFEGTASESPVGGKRRKNLSEVPTPSQSQANQIDFKQMGQTIGNFIKTKEEKGDLSTPKRAKDAISEATRTAMSFVTPLDVQAKAANIHPDLKKKTDALFGPGEYEKRIAEVLKFNPEASPLPNVGNKFLDDYANQGVNYLSNTQDKIESIEPHVKKDLEEEALEAQGGSDPNKIVPLNPDQYKFAQGMQPELLEQSPNYAARMQATEKAMEEENQDQIGITAPSFFDEILEDPMKNATFSKVTGIDYTEEVNEALKEYQNVINSQIEVYGQTENSLTEEEKRIKARLDSGEITKEDQIMLGLLVVLPMILGGLLGGKAAAFAAGGGMASGIADSLMKQKEGLKEDEKRLSDIALKKADLATQTAEAGLSPFKFQSDLQKAYKDRVKGTAEEYLKGRDVVTVTDPKTGKKQTGVLLNDGIYADADAVLTEKDKDRMIEKADKLAEMKVSADALGEVTDDIIGIASQLKDKGKIGKMWANYIFGKNPDFKPEFGEEVDYKGKKVNSAMAIGSLFARLTKVYNAAANNKALTDNVVDHISRIMSDPTTSLSTPQDLIDQMEYIQDVTQGDLIRKAKSERFLTAPLESSFIESRNKRTATKGTKKEIQESDALLGNSRRI